MNDTAPREKTKGEKIREAKRYMEARRDQAEKAHKEGSRAGGQSNGQDAKASAHGPKPLGVDTRQEAAEVVGVAERSIHRGKKVLDAAEGDDPDADAD